MSIIEEKGCIAWISDTENRVIPDPEKIRCVRDHPASKTQTEAKRFLGLSGYYRQFVHEYSRIAKSLTSL